MSNFEYVAENMSPNPNIGQNIQEINQTINQTISENNMGTAPSTWSYGPPPNISYCNPQGASYFPVDNIVVNPEDLFKGNKAKTAIEIKSIRDCIFDILNKKIIFFG